VVKGTLAAAFATLALCVRARARACVYVCVCACTRACLHASRVLVCVLLSAAEPHHISCEVTLLGWALVKQ